MITNLSYLREMSAGNKELALEMINIFEIQIKEFAEGMENLLARKEYIQLGKLAHKAKSSISIMGLDELAQDLKTLENMTKENRGHQQYGDIIEKFKSVTNKSISELEEVKQNIDSHF